MPVSIITSNDPLDLTFGAEIECIIKVSKEQLTYLHRHPLSNAMNDDERVRQAVSYRLIEGGIPCFPFEGFLAPEAYDRWKITNDVSIDPEPFLDDDEHDYFGMELISRILRPTQDSFKEIEKVLDLIKSLFTLETNMSTGLHVHVGNQSDGFPFHTLKKFALTVVAFEHIIHSIHPDDRIDRDAWWCRPPSFNFDLAGLLHFEQISKVESCKDISSIIDVLNSGNRRESAYNFQNLINTDPDLEKSKQTIEFRQHAGSSDSQEITSWVDFATGLVHYCHEVPMMPHLVLCLNKSLDPSFTVLGLMKVIGRSRLIDFYEPRLHHRASPGQDEEDLEYATFFEGFSFDYRTEEEARRDQSLF